MFECAQASQPQAFVTASKRWRSKGRVPMSNSLTIVA